MHTREPNVIRQDLANTKASMAKNTVEIARKQVELAALRKETATLMQPHVGESRMPSSVSLRRDKLVKLATDIELLESCNEVGAEAIAQLEAELAEAEQAERMTCVTMRLQGLTGARNELVTALERLDTITRQQLEREVLPILKRFKEHSAESFCQALHCPTINTLWERHPDVARMLQKEFTTAATVLANAPTKATREVEEAISTAQDFPKSATEWISRHAPQRERFTPTPPPAPEQVPSWKPATVQEAQRLGLLWVCPETGRKIICSVEQLAALQANRRAEMERLCEEASKTQAQLETGELPQRT